MTPEEYLNDYTELTPKLARELRLENWKKYDGIECCYFAGWSSSQWEPSRANAYRITNRLRIQLHPLLALVWASGAKECTLVFDDYNTMIDCDQINPEAWFPIIGNPLNLPEDLTMKIERPKDE